MTPAIERVDLERFRAIVARGLGLNFDDTKLDFLAEILLRRTEAVEMSPTTYLERLENHATRDEIRTLAGPLTVAETYFFRNIDQFRALTDVALPDRLAARSVTRRLNLLSAGCASGEEAYSLAIAARERAAGVGIDVSIRAVDINPAVLEKAAAGRFSPWALRETPADVQRRWFAADGRDFILDRAIRTAVTFEEHNLTQANPDLWPADYYDIVFCRNVLMYFTPDAARAVVARIARSLVPGGYLFLGHAETLRGLSHAFHLCHTHGTFYYRRKDGADCKDGAETADAAPPHLLNNAYSTVAPSVAEPGWTATWIETIQRASDRIQALSEARAPELVAPRGPPVQPATEMKVAVDLLRQERFAESLALVHGFSPETARDPDVLLLRAVLLAHGGQLDAAEVVASELLAADELNAGAHYLLALCRENAGDLKAAIDHDQMASHLDPTFAMPRLHIGLMARRAGDRQTARRELGQATLLLQREDSSRLLLFGGGFSRDALMALCRDESSEPRGKS